MSLRGVVSAGQVAFRVTRTFGGLGLAVSKLPAGSTVRDPSTLFWICFRIVGHLDLQQVKVPTEPWVDPTAQPRRGVSA